jgi:hypothetical protein
MMGFEVMVRNNRVTRFDKRTQVNCNVCMYIHTFDEQKGTANTNSNGLYWRREPTRRPQVYVTNGGFKVLGHVCLHSLDCDIDITARVEQKRECR